jgi:plasmid maintenance system antidote protein VapI
MPTTKKDASDLELGIGSTDGHEWSASHLADVKAYIKLKSKDQSEEEKRLNRLFSLKYRMEEYLDTIPTKIKSVDVFLNAYLKVLNLSFKDFARNMDTTDSNLKKYVKGERKFNIDLAMKFGHFFHTSPELWLMVHTKNEFLLLNKEKSRIKKYKKYDYKKVLELQTA